MTPRSTSDLPETTLVRSRRARRHLWAFTAVAVVAAVALGGCDSDEGDAEPQEAPSPTQAAFEFSADTGAMPLPRQHRFVEVAAEFLGYAATGQCGAAWALIDHNLRVNARATVNAWDTDEFAGGRDLFCTRILTNIARLDLSQGRVVSLSEDRLSIDFPGYRESYISIAETDGEPRIHLVSDNLLFEHPGIDAPDE